MQKHRPQKISMNPGKPMLLETFPPRAEFRSLLESASVVPVGARILADTETPVSVLARFAPHHPHLFLLESAEGGERWGRYSFMGVSARATVAVYRHDVVVRQGIEEKRIPHQGDPPGRPARPDEALQAGAPAGPAPVLRRSRRLFLV
jgi:hypothetical protein